LIPVKDARVDLPQISTRLLKKCAGSSTWAHLEEEAGMNVATRIFSTPDDQVAWLGTEPVPATAYYDPDWYERERRAIFLRTWIEVGHVCELPEPGTWIRRELEFADASILIVRGKDGAIRAFYNACTHRGTELVEEESGKGANFLCPYHSWNFGDDGRLIAAPDFQRFALTKEQCRIPGVAVDTCAGLIFVNLDPEPKQGLREFLGAYAEQMETMPVAKASPTTTSRRTITCATSTAARAWPPFTSRTSTAIRTTTRSRARTARSRSGSTPSR
jgi:nitrite reductase/ring-hydroxylating ferredoxin subunit